MKEEGRVARKSWIENLIFNLEWSTFLASSLSLPSFPSYLSSGSTGSTGHNLQLNPNTRNIESKWKVDRRLVLWPVSFVNEDQASGKKGRSGQKCWIENLIFNLLSAFSGILLFHSYSCLSLHLLVFGTAHRSPGTYLAQNSFVFFLCWARSRFPGPVRNTIKWEDLRNPVTS